MLEARKNIFTGDDEGRGAARFSRWRRVEAGKGWQAPLPSKKNWARLGSAGVMQGAEFLDQQFAGDQFQLEIKRALHQYPDGFLLGHGIFPPWEWSVASAAVFFTYLIGVFADKLDGENERWEGPGKKKMPLALIVSLTR